jgi:hypothetical protein
MDTQKKDACRKKSGREVSFDFKLSVIDEINNGLISIIGLGRTFANLYCGIGTWQDRHCSLY